MRYPRSGLTLALSLASFLLPPGALAQVLGPPIRPAASMVWVAPRQLPPNRIPVRIHAEEKHDYTVLGLVIGAGLGFVAGWSFYNAMCEAVDNDCADSRLPYLAIGTGLGGGLGALIGSVAD
jgi:hypothetical protein